MRAPIPNQPRFDLAVTHGGDFTETEVDLIFHALADATRRDIVRRCLEGESSVSGLAESYPMSFAAVQKHVAVLERAGLITKERNGREQIVRTDVETVRCARDMLDQLERTWRGRVGRMDTLLDQVPDPDSRSSIQGEER
jgi:DNA-binding transcriptional ArsR family regulator